MAPSHPKPGRHSDDVDGLIGRLQAFQAALSIEPEVETPSSLATQPAGNSTKKKPDLCLIDPHSSWAQYGYVVLSGLIILAVCAIPLTLFCLKRTMVSLITAGVLIVTRHFYIIGKHPSLKASEWMVANHEEQGPDLSKLPATFFLYVFGSGGHTTEMIAMIKQSLKPNPNQHRRYIITSGDQHSQNQEIALEAMIRDVCSNGSAGTYDTLVVTRARVVHQSYLTSAISSLKCALEILVALTKIPDHRAGQPNSQAFKYPHVIITNGPGTGFIVGLVAHLLKICFLAPENRLRIVFVETWARTHNLGLTGKLFYWTNIADLFVVQSSALSKIVGKPDIGNVNLRLSQIGQPTSATSSR